MSVAKQNVEDFYPLSPMQQGMLFHSMLAPGSGVYVEQWSCTLTGHFDLTAFRQAWQRVMDRHAILRTGFLSESQQGPIQVVYRKIPLVVDQKDWQELSESAQAEALEAYLEADRERGFDLKRPPLMRFSLLQTGPERFEFVWSHHHILLDGWSMPLLLFEFFTFYDQSLQGKELAFPAPRPYREYIGWLHRQDMVEAETFWRLYLEGFTSPTQLTLATRRGMPEEESTKPAEEEIWLSPEDTIKLQEFARENQLTLSTLIHAAWGLLLQRYSGEEDIVFGTTVSGRPAELSGAETMIGLFINTLPVRVKVTEEDRVTGWLQTLQRDLAQMRQYEYSPLVQIQDWSEVPHELPLFNTLTVFENYPVDPSQAAEWEGLAVENIQTIEQTNFPLNFIVGAADEVMLKIVYDQELYSTVAIQRMLGHLAVLLEGMQENPDGLVLELPLLTATEEQQLLLEWNDTDTSWPYEMPAHTIFEKMVAQQGTSPALHYERQFLSYAELNERANQLAHYLIRKGVPDEAIIAICMSPSFEMIIAVLGVLKAGCAYLPMDPSYPLERLKFMVEDSGAAVVLLQEALSPSFDGIDGKKCFLDSVEMQAVLARETAENPDVDIPLDHLAYVIYTSGSTGKPKGSLLIHRGLCNLAQFMIQYTDLSPDSRQLQYVSFGFDASVMEIFSVLLAGGMLCLAKREHLSSAIELLDLLRNEKITHTMIPPSMLSVLEVDELPDLELVITAGEACPVEVARRWSSQSWRLINAYGPSECTVAASHLDIESHHLDDVVNLSIGRTLTNVDLYVLDTRQRLVPIGVVGELCIGGNSLGRGYLDRPALTAEKFISHPFKDDAETRIYRTGDLVRYQADGNIEFLGRMDTQVKVRGFRIEIGEIETALTAHSDVKSAVVVVRQLNGNSTEKELAAFLIAEDEVQPGVEELRDHLEKDLPVYMVPASFHWLEAFPLTPNNKTDRKRLAAMSGGLRPDLAEAYLAPRDFVETQLVKIWEDVLDVHPVGVKDDFFALGGHSLLAVRIVGQVQKSMKLTVPLTSLFEATTVEKFASIIRKLQSSDGKPNPSLIPLQPKGKAEPLFVVHPTGGSVHWYGDLAKALGEGRPVYGLQARGLMGDAPIHKTIGKMAAHYVKEIQTVQPEGPYHLASWSLGVIIAFEMAQQFSAAGEEVAFLGMLDQGPFPVGEKPKDLAGYLVAVFGQHLSLDVDELREMDNEGQIARVYQIARDAEWIYPDITQEMFQYYVYIQKTHADAWRKYKAKSYAGHVYFFRAEESEHEENNEIDLGWGKLADGGVEIFTVPGDHLTMIHPPHVKTLARTMRQCLGDVVVDQKLVEKAS
jgi:amino acid adenylation domain-containing protein